MSSVARQPQAGDAGLRREALDPAQSWMLQAPAGSGKTELLMQRFLSCLAAVEQPESVLAITFTRKAAGEMRNRILTALRDAGGLTDDEIDSLPEHKQVSLRLARKVLEVSDAQGWKILSHPARLQVRTLDSFCEALAQRAPFKGLLGGVAEISEDARRWYEMAAQRVIEELAKPGTQGDAVAVLLKHLDNNVAGARAQLAGMLAQREQWLRFLGRSDVFDRSQQQLMRQRLEDALALAIEEDLRLVRARAAAALDREQHAELFTLIRYRAANDDDASDCEAASPHVIDSIAASAEPMPISAAASRSNVHCLQEIAAWPTSKADSLPLWRAIAEFLLVGGKAQLRAKVDKRNGFPCNTQTQRDFRDRCQTLLKQVAQSPASEALCEALHRVRRLPEPRYSEGQWEFMRALLELLPRAAAHLQLVFAEQGSIDFAEYARRALDAIGEEGDPTELGLQLGYRIRHILVDEFQDTNRGQVELLVRLVHTWEPDEACSTFCVGDPMQSIYAFRQADIAIYQQARRDGLGGRPHRIGCLTQNFRSQRKLVEWFNGVFSTVFREPSDLTNAVAYSPAECTRAALDGEAVEVRGFAAGDRTAEAKHLAECIRRELDLPVAANEKPSSIAVLVRARSHLPHLVEALRTAGIRYRAVKTDPLAERPVVRDLEAVRSALTDLADRTAWLAVLRAPWCGLELADLLELCRNDEQSTVCELVRTRQSRLSAAGQAALVRCWPVLESALAGRGRVSIRELVESTWLQLGGPSCLSACDERVRDAEAYLALLDEQSHAAGLWDPQQFASKLQELYAPADPARDIRVEIMPIHQAKGLEWDVVFLPALDRPPRQDDKRLLYWRARRRGEEELLLLGPMDRVGEDNGKEASIESYLRGLADDCAREELKRLFYVAATRARIRLYLSAATDVQKQPRSGSMLRLLWNDAEMRDQFVSAQEPATAPEPGDDAAQESRAAEPMLRRISPALAVPPLPELEPPLQWSATRSNPTGEQHRFEWVGDLLPRVGVVTHSFLQRIANDGLPRWDEPRLRAARPAIANALANLGVCAGEMEQAVRRVSDALRRTLQDERGRWVLSPHEEHCCELTVSAMVDGEIRHLRIDRTFVEQGTRWVIDYKLTEQQGGDRERFLQMQVEKYCADMQRYARVLRALDAAAGVMRPVRCALYFPLQSHWREVDVAEERG